MSLDYETVLNCKFPDIERSYSAADSILYALGLGLGEDPGDPDQLKFVYEKDLIAFPTMPVIFGFGGTPMAELPEMASLDYAKLVHSEEKLIIHQPLPPSGDILCRTKVSGIIDKGADKGAILYRQREIFSGDENLHYATLEESLFLRGNGGFAEGLTDKGGTAPAPHTLPAGAPDKICDITTLPQSALLYRLSGDGNPLHADPERATSVGFVRPILHGLCSFGIAAWAILQSYGGMNPERLKTLQVRFSAPVYPGDTIRFEFWQDAAGISFRARVLDRDAVVLNNGLATLMPILG